MQNKVIFITGASRGIGRAIALRCAKEKASVIIAAKTVTPHANPALAGTIHSVADEVRALGGEALPIAVDVRDDNQIEAAVQQTIERFGRIDVLINNAGYVNLTRTTDIPLKQLDLLYAVNARATLACAKACIPYLAKADNPHIINLSPPIDLSPKWFKDHLPYTVAKYSVSLCTLGLAEELKSQGIAVNSLWPKTLIATAAIAVHFPEMYAASRTPDIVAEAAYQLLLKDSRNFTGKFLLDEEILRELGTTDFKQYAVDPNVAVLPDLYVDMA